MESEPAVFRQFVLKLHSRCDLACDHCYVYEHADTSWRRKPRTVSADTLRQTARRIAEHAFAHRLPEVRVVLHGGEPLLAGVGTIQLAADALRAELGQDCALDLRIQTNGVRLDEEFLEVFRACTIKVGISLDGDRSANDRHRRYADGRSSHDQVVRAVNLLRQTRYRHLYAGLLCTVDVRNDPLAVYAALRDLEPPAVDFLLPHATWDRPPPRPDGPETTPYADWLGVIHQRWQQEDRPMKVRMFDSVLRTLNGQSSLTESLGLEPTDLVVVETDGTLEQADSLKTAYDGAPVTGLDVMHDPFDAAALHPGVADRRGGAEALSAVCRSCPVLRSCGGGLFAHRYREGSGFDNPSVYCADLKAFIDRVSLEREATVPAGSPPALSDGRLDQLAAGPGAAEVVRALADGELLINGELLDHLRRRSAGSPVADRAWELVLGLSDEAPDAVSAVLAHPYLRPWAQRVLNERVLNERALNERALNGRGGDGPERLAELAAAMALRAGVATEVELPLRDGSVYLPTLGALRVGGVGRAVVGTGDRVVRANGATLRLAEDEPRWQPLRRLRIPAVGQYAAWQVAVEDTDPERDCYRTALAPRLGAEELAAWEAELAGAWRLVVAELPEYAAGLWEGLAVITPLAAPPGGGYASAAARSCFGAVGVARPGSPEQLAQLLLHEFQHVKLGAVLDQVELFDGDYRGVFSVPWREDRRPLEGALQGAYAHLALADFWRARAGSLVGRESDRARERSERFRDWTVGVATQLLESDALSPSGERFVTVLRATLAAHGL